MKPYYACVNCSQWLCWKDALERNAEAETEIFGQSITHGSHKTPTWEEVSPLRNDNNDLNSLVNQLKDLAPVLLKEHPLAQHGGFLKTLKWLTVTGSNTATGYGEFCQQ
ncbi:unnamed protein product [Cuscuta campestris]|uniref:Uncharacterized protein n=1 Tax=Cuscuta campestris TaxID=132261 RepID=A0A484NKF0_9ASTE|nr:unnamed protein product [Cuscuta campestris]